jgi:Membrane domain of glycerophosphoryl diester phosphodiesterase
MSQNPPDGWVSPSSGDTPPPQAAPGPAPGWGYGAPVPGYAGFPPPANLPPPAAKPGVVPLRPLGLGEILDGAVQTIRQNPAVMLGLSAVVNAVLTLLAVLVQIGNLSTAFGGFSSFNDRGPDQADVDVSQIVASLVAALLQFIGTTLLTGLLVIAVSDAVLGRRPGIGEVWRRARGRLWALLGVTILVLLAVAAAGTVCVLPGILLAVAGGGLSAILLIVAGALAAVALCSWIAIRLLFAPPTLLLERSGVLPSMSRSWRLVKGSWWRCFGVWLLAQLLGSVLSGVLQLPLLIVASVVDSDSTKALVIVLTILASVIARTLVAPFSAAILALLYIDLRMRREGLDVRLQQAAAT